MIPGLEATLDSWRSKPRTSSEYTYIIDGDVSRVNLKAPDGTLFFFSNCPDKPEGPNKELCQGINLVIECYVLYLNYGIERIEIEKTRQAESTISNRRAPKVAKRQGKEAHAREKARIAKEKEIDSAAKIDASLKAAATKQAEKVRLAAEKEAQKARFSAETKAARYRKKVTERLSCNARSELLTTCTADDVPPVADAGDESDKELTFDLHSDDDADFLKRSAALRMLMHHTVSDPDIDHADTLIRRYTSELLRHYASNGIKPSHHYATHIASFTNYHADGEPETTFVSEFHRMCESNRFMPEEALPCEVAENLLKASAEGRGTVVDLPDVSKELDKVNADGFCFRSPLTTVYCRSDGPVIPHSIPLNREATLFDYVVIKGKRCYA
ncbi:hypothetical protein DFJ58DRAFT_848009 [Suillus subalutaceus]|uniref:uncharacterized protein n=1 Tax=Suillus subalutaceus TaxID=48586 RepID=UPI001B86809F|nr:uncharacterized protein DFJ58DRAFT_848009 [Suillus subalutaceus]KAG1832559.1 hypothetical protein DFJ58DRAFT_848009 [Suillus subalutaceus]